MNNETNKNVAYTPILSLFKLLWFKLCPPSIIVVVDSVLVVMMDGGDGR